MKEKPVLTPYKMDTELTGYLPVPRSLIGTDLPSTAILIYGALLDRGTLSRKNHYADDDGQVYVLYSLEHLTETFQLSDTAVKRHLRELEDWGLIRRFREKRYSPSHIFLSLPAASRKEPEEGTKCPEENPKSAPNRGRKVPPNNLRKQHNSSNDYQHGEDESL